jgi:aminocarboxymuconate-semialdehyde decarboxylase
MALHYLIFDGVLERHPKLKLVAVHGGGYLPAYSGRMDHAWGARSDSHGALPHPPTTYLKRVYVDGIVFTPHQLEALVALLRADHVMLGTITRMTWGNMIRWAIWGRPNRLIWWPRR